MKQNFDQPGVQVYFLGRGFKNLKNRLIWYFNKNLDSAKKQLKFIDKKGYITISSGPRILSALFMFVFSFIILALMAIVRGSILFVFYILAFIILSFVWLIDNTYNTLHKFSNACPNPTCQAKFKVPAYECPNCGAIHTNLVPGKYGILKRKCLCGANLPTTFFKGKGKLQAYCPKCSCTLEGQTAVRQYAIPVIGGPSVGKTCFINMLISQMITKVAPEKNWSFEFVSKENKIKFNTISSNMQKGIRPLKTELELLTPYPLMLKLPNNKFGRRIYLYDISGEKFSSSEDIQKNIAYTYANGLIFIVDPLSLSRYRAEIANKVDIDSYAASYKDSDSILNLMLINLEKIFLRTSKDMFNINLAVVINKLDIPGLEEKIGKSAVEKYINRHNNTLSESAAQNIVCEKFLETYGAGNFVRSVARKFNNFQYFACSSLGHNEEGTAFKAKGVEDPLLWILNQVDNKINLNN